MKNALKKFGWLAASILLCQLAGFVGSFYTAPAIATWYATLNKPFFTPPSWVFAPAWITLYTMMGLSLFLVWSKSRGKLNVFTPFAVQLALNAIWSAVFFGLKSPAAAFMVIMLLWLAIAWTIKSFRMVSRTAALLLVPYLLWVTFAALLNWSITLVN